MMRWNLVILVLCGMCWLSKAGAIMRVTKETADGVVHGPHVLCLKVEHVAAVSQSEKAAVTHTRQAIGCELGVRPLVELNGKKGISLKIALQKKQVLIAYQKQVEVCFNFKSDMDDIAKTSKSASVKLLGLGEFHSACAPDTDLTKVFGTFDPVNRIAGGSIFQKSGLGVKQP